VQLFSISVTSDIGFNKKLVKIECVLNGLTWVIVDKCCFYH